MKGSTLAMLAGVAILGYAAFSSMGGAITPAPQAPDNPGGLDLVAVFERSDDKRQSAMDACEFACLCEEIASVIEFDGKQSEPQLKNGVQLDNFRSLSRYYQAEGASYASRYPALASDVGKYLDEQLGKDGGPVDAAKRAKWVNAYRSIGKSAHYAADYLEWKHG